MKKIRFIVILLIIEFVFWYLIKGLLWIEFKMKAYTQWGIAAMTWGQHIVFILLAIYAAVMFNVALEKRR